MVIKSFLLSVIFLFEKVFDSIFNKELIIFKLLILNKIFILGEKVNSKQYYIVIEDKKRMTIKNYENKKIWDLKKVAIAYQLFQTRIWIMDWLD